MRIFRLLLLGLLSAACAAQVQPVTQTVAATAICVSINASNNSTVGIIVSGTWSGTFTPNLQISAATSAPTVAKKVVPVDSTTAQATVTANGGYRADVAGFARFNFCSTGTWTSGTATVTLYAVPPPAASTVASGGGGGVTSVFTRTGAVTASSGDYTVAQVTGAAPAASPTFTGTVTLPGLAAATPWATSSHGSLTAGIFSTSANKAAFVQVQLPFPLTTTQVTYFVGTADTVNTGSNYDIGIYSGTSGGTCTLQAHTGPIAASTSMTANAHTVAWTGGSVTLQPGRYYIAYTSAATTATAILVGDSAQTTLAGGGSAGSVGNVTVTAGGTLDASRTCPTDAMSLATATILILN
jgi:hypothetical protein